MTDLWLTNETPPRAVVVKGRSAMNPDRLVGVCGNRTVWIYSTGYIPELGRDVFALPENGADDCPYAEAQAELQRCGLSKIGEPHD